MVETIHFTIGADLGIRLMEISQEHLLYNADVDKALNVFNESFGGGCPFDMQLELLIGKKVVEVDVEDQCFLVSDRKEHHNSVYPAMINLRHFFKEKEKQVNGHCKDFEQGLAILFKNFRYKNTYSVNFDIESVVKYIHGNDEDIIKELKYDYELSEMKTFIQLIKEFTEKTLKFSKLVKKLNFMFPDENIEFDTYQLTNLMEEMKNISNLDFSSYEENENENIELDNYISSIAEIDEVISKGIEPVDIMDNYSAGWLSPEGDYYALNGEIANMLHNQIADALQEKGIITETEDDYLSNDSWLEQQGWVKIHGNNIQFGGCLNHKIGKENVHMTDIQKKLVYDYCGILHGGIVRAGWRMTRVSAIRFRETDNLMLAKNYFDYN